MKYQSLKAGFFPKTCLPALPALLLFAFMASPWMGARAQDREGSVAEKPAENPKKILPGPTAEEILSKAAEVQGGAKIAGNLDSFTAEFTTEYFNQEKGRVYYDVKRRFQFPLRLWTEKKHEMQDKPTIEVYDGEEGWLVKPDGEVVVYLDNPTLFETDMENLEHDVRLTKQMFKYFFIANLRSEIKGMERLSDNPVLTGGNDLFVVAGRTQAWIGGDQERTVYLKIYVDPKTYLVRAVRMTDLNPDGLERLFLFDKYLKNPQGVQVPGLVSMYTGHDSKPEMKINMSTEKEGEERIAKITFNEKIDPALFVIPEKEGE